MSEREISDKFIEAQLKVIEDEILQIRASDANDKNRGMYIEDINMRIKLFARDMLDCPTYLQPTGDLAKRIDCVMSFHA